MRTIRANGEHHLTFICQLVFVACISINTQIASEAKRIERVRVFGESLIVLAYRIHVDYMRNSFDCKQITLVKFH